MPHQQQAEQRESDREHPVVLQDVDTGEPLCDQERQRDPDRGRKDDAHEIRARGKPLRAPVQPERAVQADDREREEQREQRGIRMRDIALPVHLEDEHDRGEQPRQLGTELEQRCAGNVLSQ